MQEPWIGANGNTTAGQHWRVFYPSTKPYDNQAATRSIILVDKHLVSDSVHQLDIPSSDITAVQIGTTHGTLSIFNIYNDCKHNDSITTVKQHLENVSRQQHNGHVLLLGDFNRHHSLWELTGNEHLASPPNLIDPLLDLIVEFGLEMALPPGIPTLCSHATKNWTRPDNVWRLPTDTDPIIECNTIPELTPPKTDHIPIKIVLLMKARRSESSAKRNFRGTDWEKLTETFEQANLQPAPVNSLNTQLAMDSEVERLTKAIQQAIESATPLHKERPHVRRWWTRDLRDLQRRRNRLGRERYRWRGTPNHPIHEEYRMASQEFTQELRKTREEHWEGWLESIADTDSLWQANKYLSREPTDLSTQYIPTLHTADGAAAITNIDKCGILSETFFPPPPPDPYVLYTPPETYPTPIDQFRFYSLKRIEAVIQRVQPYKAPGPDGIPNIIYKKLTHLVAPLLRPIFNAVMKHGIYPKAWKESNTIVLRKPGRPSYTNPNAYRPIALINTMGKLLSTLVAEDLTYISEKHQLLPANQFGGRPGRSTTDALHYLTQTIKNAWAANRVVSVLLLDIKAAFPNVVIPVLIHNMRKRRVPEVYTNMVTKMLRNRQTRLCFDDYVSEPISIDNGNGQGCPLSMIFYAFYIAPLQEAMRKTKTEDLIGFVDDNSLVAIGNTVDETHNTLTDMMTRPNGALEWSISHNSQFAIDKLALINFTRSRSKLSAANDLEIQYTTTNGTQMHFKVKRTESAKLLGVHLDQHLSFSTHRSKTLAKAVKWTAIVRRFNRTMIGITPRLTRQLYISVAIPQITYAADVWYTPPHKKDRAARMSGDVGFTQRLDSIQRQATILITGGMRTSAGDTLRAHADLYSSKLTLLNACLRGTLRLATKPKDHPLAAIIRRPAYNQRKRHRSTLHTLFNIADIDIDQIEKIPATKRNPNARSPFTTIIDETPEQAIERDVKQRNTSCIIYTDGSGYKGGIGAAAALYSGGVEKKALTFHLGSEKEHTVFEGELVGILLALKLADMHADEDDNVIISLDNESAIQTTNKAKPGAATYIIKEITKQAAIQTKGIQQSRITLCWIPGHHGVPGNERADELAKEAAQGTNSPTHTLPALLTCPLPTSASSIKTKLQALIKNEHAEEWQTSKRFSGMRQIDPSLPSRKFLKLTASYPRYISSIILQLRTSHSPLNHHLYRIKRTDSPLCPGCLEENETTEHYLLRCQVYCDQRLKIQRAHRRHASKLNFLLATPKGIKATVQFIKDTKRFQEHANKLTNSE